jgi:hypothetical protein
MLMLLVMVAFSDAQINSCEPLRPVVGLPQGRYGGPSYLKACCHAVMNDGEPVGVVAPALGW